LPGCDPASGEAAARTAGRFSAGEKNYEDFLKRYPRSPRKREAQEALAELALLQNGDAPLATNKKRGGKFNGGPLCDGIARANAPAHPGQVR